MFDVSFEQKTTALCFGVPFRLMTNLVINLSCKKWFFTALFGYLFNFGKLFLVGLKYLKKHRDNGGCGYCKSAVGA